MGKNLALPESRQTIEQLLGVGPHPQVVFALRHNGPIDRSKPRWKVDARLAKWMAPRSAASFSNASDFDGAFAKVVKAPVKPSKRN